MSSRFLSKPMWAFLLGGVLCLAPLTVRGALIEVGDIVLQANQAGQVVTLRITGGEQIAGADFFAQVGDGGPELVNFGMDAGADGPAMSLIDLTSGIFLGNNTGQTDLLAPVGSIPQLAAYGTSTATGSVTAEGNLVTITFDTTGFDSGTWDFVLDDTLAGSTTLYDANSGVVAATITPGSVTVVPEPSTLLLLFSGLAVGGAITLGRRWGR